MNEEKVNEYLEQITQIRDEFDDFIKNETPIVKKMFPDDDVSNGSEEEKKRANTFINVSETLGYLNSAIHQLKSTKFIDS